MFLAYLPLFTFLLPCITLYQFAVKLNKLIFDPFLPKKVGARFFLKKFRVLSPYVAVTLCKKSANF